jgi:hypothetical protein
MLASAGVLDSGRSGSGFKKESMHRRTAIFVLLLALIATCLPLAQALTAAPPHACCIRAAHHCHDSALAPSDPLALRGGNCCSHDCCRAVTTAQWGHPQSQLIAISAHAVERFVAESYLSNPAADLILAQSPRSPPPASYPE